MTVSPPDMKELMEKAKEMQIQMQQAQREISAIEALGEAGGGLVKITMNGAHKVFKVEISPTILDEESMLEDLIVAAFNDASQKIEEKSKQKMMYLAKELQLPQAED